MKSLALVVACCGVAWADEPVDRPEAFQVDRDAPPPGQAEFSFDGGGPVNDWAVSLQLGYLDRPFRLYTSQVEVLPVERRETLALGGAVRIGPAIVVDARMPLSHQTGDRFNMLGDDKPLDNWVPGDLGIGARLRLVERDLYSAFARGHVTFGTGDDFDFAGEARFTAAWMLIGRFTLPYGVVIAGNAGVRFRGAEVVVADRLLGDELFGAIGASYQLPAICGLYCDANHVRVTGELVGVLGNDVAGRRGSSPAEVRFGLVGQIRSWFAVAARVGTGINDQIGAPRFRALVELVYGAAE
jgi:hypothetical protein